MSAPESNVAHLRPSEVDYASEVGAFRVEVRKDEEGGSLVLSPSDPAAAAKLEQLGFVAGSGGGYRLSAQGRF